MSSERELLELAAKACGYTIHENGKDINGDTWYWCEQIADCWSPLTDDGDALRLVVKLELFIDCMDDRAQAFPSNGGATDTADVIEFYNGDRCAATRCAIVRAAAEIGASL